MNNFQENIVDFSVTARQAMAKLEEITTSKTLFVVGGEDRLVGTLTDGDIRRGLIKGLDVDGSVTLFMHPHFHFLVEDEVSLDKIDFLRKEALNLVPVLNKENKLIKIIDLFKRKSYLPVEAVIMAGGRGERLRPLTDSVPKPLLKVGPKPIIEHNIDRLIYFGIDKIHISVYYLSNLIKEYFASGSAKGIEINYIDEDSPIGTIGALSRAPAIKSDYVLIMNSDILTNMDFEDFFKFFVENEADMAIASIPYQVNVPYAVLEVEKNQIKSFREKPDYTFYSNAGIYLIKKELIDLIPKDQVYNATDLMECLIAKECKVISYPILGYWLDIGKLSDFSKAQEDIKHLNI